MKLLEKLTTTPAVPGREHRIRELLREQADGLFDELRTDTMGSLIGIRKPRPKSGSALDNPTKIMLAAPTWTRSVSSSATSATTGSCASIPSADSTRATSSLASVSSAPT